MSLNPLPVQEYNDAQVNRYAYPDDRPVEGADGKLFARNRKMHCPVCGTEFYAYQAVNRPQAPGGCDPTPEAVAAPLSGVRRTCGHPTCVAVEDREQFAMRKAANPGAYAPRTAPGFAPNVTEAKPRPKLQRAGEMGSH